MEKKKVLLLGDSIRMGYDSLVKDELKEYDVYYDDLDNGRFSAYTIWQFIQLNNQYGPFDLVHFNNGYWDVHKEGKNGEETFPINFYLMNLERIVKLAKEDGAKVVFALTTPIYDELYKEDPSFSKLDYLNEDIIKYNNEALKLMKKLDVPVNDLYSLLLNKEKHYYKCPDSLHLTIEGYELCAKKISEMIRDILK